MIKSFPTCLTFFNQQPNELEIKLPVPQETWIEIEAGLFRLYW